MRHHLSGIFLRCFPYFLLFSCAVDLLAKEYSRPLPHKSNHWIFNIYSPIECIYYCLLFWEVIENRQLRKLVIGLITIYCLFSIYNAIFLQGFEQFNTYTYLLETFTVVSICLFFFIENAKQENDQSIVRNPHFWIASALIITFLGDFIIMGLLNVIIAKAGSHTMLSFNIIKYLNLLKCFLFTVAFLSNSPILAASFCKRKLKPILNQFERMNVPSFLIMRKPNKSKL